jgi:cysteinyl-tRNA synthetase
MLTTAHLHPHGGMLDGKALVKLAPAEDLRRQRDEKKAAIEAKIARKAAAAAAEEQKRLAKLEKAKISPMEMFRPPNVDQGIYTAWDDTGLPIKDDKGEELTKGKSKKLKKEWDAQVKAHDEWKRIVGTGDKVEGEL